MTSRSRPETMKEDLDEVWEEDDAPRRTAEIFHMPKKIDAEKLPSRFRRTKTAHAMLGGWRKLRKAMWEAKAVPYARLPEFAYVWGRRLYETHERVAYDALCDGDVVFFEAWATRILIVDRAAEEAGLSIRERGTLLYAVGVLRGYVDAANVRLKALGGKWPITR